MSTPSDDHIRIAMWSGPRNISTAMMRAFEARPDTRVVDEPFYAAYLAATGADHPMREEVLASQPQDWLDVVFNLAIVPPDAPRIFYQKHMTHHMLEDFGLNWTAGCRNAFLIRDPARVLASYAARRSDVTLEDIGIKRQAEIFQFIAMSQALPPPVVEGADILANPEGMLTSLCKALGIPFTRDMLSWRPGRRSTDGVWAPAWYDAVEKSTGFGPPPDEALPALPDHLQRIADEARPYYEALERWKIRA